MDNDARPSAGRPVSDGAGLLLFQAIGLVLLGIGATFPGIGARSDLAGDVVAVVAMGFAMLATVALPIWATGWQGGVQLLLTMYVWLLLAAVVAGQGVGSALASGLPLTIWIALLATIWATISRATHLKRWVWSLLLVWAVGPTVLGFLATDFGPPSRAGVFLSHLSPVVWMAPTFSP